MYSAASARSNTATTATRPRSPETFDSFSERNAAAAALQSYEELSWHALQRNEVRLGQPPLQTKNLYRL